MPDTMLSNSAIISAYVAKTPKSAEWAERARETFPSGITHDSRHLAPYSLYIERAEGGRVLASASTLDGEVRKEVGKTGNIDAAAAVGRMVAERARAAGVTRVAFDRSGFKYHGRVKAFAEGARKGGLEF